MRKLVCAFIALFLSAGCGGAPRASPVDVANPQTSAAATSAPQFVELGPDQFDAPFRKETVLKLNAIVARSLSAITEYDGAIPGIRAAVDAAIAGKASAEARADARIGVARIEGLAGEAKSARDDLRAAEAALKASGEKYNDEILAGMIIFVEKVDDELRSAAAELKTRLDD